MKTNKYTRWLVALGMIMAMLLSMVAGAEDAQTVTKNDFTTVGSYVTFGRYEQDNDEANGPEPIEWLVLDYDAENNRALLISVRGLDAKQYNTRSTSVTWEQCTLRTWLNNDFLNEAFTTEEQGGILLTEVDNSQSQGDPHSDAFGGNNTQDRVFLLSYAEALQYFESNGTRRCAPTTYAIVHGAAVSSRDLANGKYAGWWWLRSPGHSQDYAASVKADNSLDKYSVTDKDVVVRPAIWLNLSDSEPKGIVGETPGIDAALCKTVGSYVAFGHYEQDNNVANGSELIEWLILDYDAKNNRVLLLSRYGLDAKRYNEEYVDITWEECTLRAWLNEDFLNAAFTASEQSAILTTTVDNSKSQGYSGYSTDGGNNTQDKIFLLSYAEAHQYFGVEHYSYYKDSSGNYIYTNIASRVIPTAYAIQNGAGTSSDYQTAEGIAAGWWWLRSPGSGQDRAAYVYTDGSLYYFRVNRNYGSVRPAFWLNLDADVF